MIASTDRPIDVDNVGPVTHVSIPLPAGGGVTVLKGRNGCGKSTVLRGVGRLCGGKAENLTPRDGEISGKIVGIGAKLTIGRTTTRLTGEVEVSIVDGVNPGKIIDPGFKDQEANDTARIHELVRLSGENADVGLFYELAGGKEAFEALLPGIGGEYDIIKLAGKVRRGLQAEALKKEKLAEQERGKAAGLKQSAQGVDLEQNCDNDELAAELEAAIAHNGSLQQRLKAHRESEDAKALARAQLTKAKDQQAGLKTIEEASIAYVSANSSCLDLETKREELVEQRKKLDEQIRMVEAEHRAAVAARDAADSECESAKQRQSMLEQWEQTIAASGVEAPTEAELQASSERVTNARQAIESGAVVRAAKVNLERADVHNRNGHAYEVDAKSLREAAAGVDDILSTLVEKAGTPLKVEGGRLIINNERGKVYFSDLSDGERTDIVVSAILKIAGKNGLVILDQQYYESLDPINEQELARLAIENQVNVLTARCSADEEINAEVVEVG